MSNLMCSKCCEKSKYLGSSWCSDCINQGKRKLRKQKKELGISSYGDQRKATCNNCNLPKEENYMNDSLCQTCRSDKNKDDRILKRAKQGLLPWGAGRKLECSTCGSIKEGNYRNESRCRRCKREAKKEIRVVRIVEDHDFYLKDYARKTLYRNVVSGKILRSPCEKCGSIKVEGHHDDYTKPLEVRWLCRTHHLEHHSKESKS